MLLFTSFWPTHACTIPDTQDTFTKNVERFCILGVLKHQHASKWALPLFVVPNKIKPYDFLVFWGCSKRLVRNPLPIPKKKHGIAWVNKSYATALDLNWGYYTIKIGLRCIQNLCHNPSSEVQSKMIFMGHQISSSHVPVIRSFFIFWKTLLSSWNLPYDHLPIHTNINFQYPKKWPSFVP